MTWASVILITLKKVCNVKKIIITIVINNRSWFYEFSNISYFKINLLAPPMLVRRCFKSVELFFSLILIPIAFIVFIVFDREKV